MRITDKSQLEHLSPHVRGQLERALDSVTPAPAAKSIGRPEQEVGRRLVQWIDGLEIPAPWPAHRNRPTTIKVGEYFAHNANGGARTAIEGAILRGQGVRAGWPDYTLYVPRGRWHGAVLELKAEDGDKPTAEQLDVLERLEWIGFFPIIAWGFEEARVAIIDYLAITDGRRG